jgi:hypothetical protein
MSYGTWLVTILASAVTGVDRELCRQLAPLLERLTQRVVSFFGPRPVAGRGLELRA